MSTTMSQSIIITTIPPGIPNVNLCIELFLPKLKIILFEYLVFKTSIFERFYVEISLFIFSRNCKMIFVVVVEVSSMNIVIKALSIKKGP